MERGSKEYTLDDFYSLALDKLDRYVTLKKCDVEVPKEGVEIESSDEDDDEEEEKEDERKKLERKALSALAALGYNVTAADFGKLVPPDLYEQEMDIMAEVRAYFHVAYKVCHSLSL